ncbi:MAG: hypothetical protein M4D80_34865 [Myxococcota bacterium]|nr:hypothetical protein [Deltaproteobacteria bacterium]MDQ3340369.1 hypothetical protein [Myxococcota bacterium]
MLLARGAIQDRPFGKTVGSIAHRGVSGQLTAECDGGTYAIVFDRGHIVAATSPNVSDSAAAIALALDLITPAQIATIERWLDAVPEAEELHVLATVALMTADEIHRLRRRVIAQRAARMIALEHGEFVLTSTVGIQIYPDCEMHVGGVIYQAARLYIYDTQLRAFVTAMGTRFELRADAHDELIYYGFGDAERPFLRALATGISMETIQSMPSESDRRIALSTLYALASCGGVYCEKPATVRFARGTRGPVRDARDSTPPITATDQASLATEPLTTSNAEEAFQRAEGAMRGDRIDDAVFDLELATQLSPNEPRYFAALAWARFCRAPDKSKVANQTRAMLNRAITRSDAPILPHYYLGMVERMMNRHEAAIGHFREVLELQPNHQEAATEIRFLTRKY